MAKMSACNLTQEELRSACAPVGAHSRGGCQLAPLLHDLLALLSVRGGEERMEYYVSFIFTDGMISDMDNAMKV